MADEMKAPVDYDPDNYDPEKLLNDPNWKQPGPDDFEYETGATEDDNILHQADARKWMRRPPEGAARRRDGQGDEGSRGGA